MQVASGGWKRALSLEPQEGTCPCQGPEVRTSDLQTWERTNLCCFKPLVCGVLYGSPGRLTHLPTQVNMEQARGLVTHPQVLEGTETARYLGPAAELSSGDHRGWLAEGAAQVARRGLRPACSSLSIWVSGVHTGGVCLPLQMEW